ncbi:MAG: EAL domain-containing protein [Candidatus Dormiibacterota bacterium]
MFDTLDAARRRVGSWRLARRPSSIWLGFGLLGLLVIGYLISRLLRSPTSYSPLLDGWLVSAAELAAGLLCLAAARTWRRDRTIPLLLGVAFFAGAIGTAVLAQGGGTQPAPSLGDAFYLSFYPLAYAALVLLMRRDTGSLVPSAWLDGAVSGLGAAALCACFAFKMILSWSGTPLGVATNLAYPIGGLVLLAMVVGVTASLGRRPGLQWNLLASACGIIVIGGTFNLLLGTGPSQFGRVISDVAAPAAMLLAAMAMWVTPRPVNLLSHGRAPGFFLPGLGAGCGLAILLLAPWEHPSEAAVWLATVTLVVASVRFGLSAHSLRTLTERRHSQAVTDELTGLGNRRQLFSVLDAFFEEQADPRTPRRSLSLLYVDLNHFKQINDTFGHAAGDEVLRQLGPRLQGALRGSDLVVRLGGDELAVVVVNADPQIVTAVAQRLMDRVQQPFMLNQVVVRVSASIGVASAPADASDSASLVRCGDLAMYRAKRSESAIETYRQELDRDSSQLSLVKELWAAIELGSFTLHYQPQLELGTGAVPAVEALLRWNNPRLGFVPPMEFLPLAEEAGLMGRLTTWVLDQALAQCATWRATGRDLTVSVNISVSNLLDPSFNGLVQKLLAHHRLPTSSLMIELTETTVIADFEASKAAIAELRQLGLGVSIDDFGAGFTSLAYLADLDFSELKLDRSFITRLSAGRARDLALVGATIELAHALQLQVVAEGIEDVTTLDMLVGVGCDLAQGYYIGRPVPASELAVEPAGILSEYRLARVRAS